MGLVGHTWKHDTGFISLDLRHSAVWPTPYSICAAAGGVKGRFDLLPHVMQSSPETGPQMFPVPPSYKLEVPMSHPVHHWFAELGLKVRYLTINLKFPSPLWQAIPWARACCKYHASSICLFMQLHLSPVIFFKSLLDIPLDRVSQPAA